MDFLRRRPALALLVLALLLALAFQGTRGLWDPDEGRYTNVALQILRSGDWISLHRHADSLHFTKPPLTYWSMAASVAVFGWNTWAVRLPMALAFALTTWLVYRLGRVFVPARPWLPALVYLTAPLPFLAANYISTDGMLTAMETVAVACYVHARFAGGGPRWIDAMWAGFGLAFLTKGPPGLLPLLAIVVFHLLDRDAARPRLLRWQGLLAFAAIGFTWYVVVVLRHPGLLDYFLGHEVVARVASASLDRSPEWYGWLKVYGPALACGLLPWLPLALWRTRAAWGKPDWKAWSAEQRFLWLWLLVPLLVFCLSRSRMWLYVLPLFGPLALLVARGLGDVDLRRPARVAAIAAWLLLLLAIKGGLAHPFGNGSIAQGLRRNSAANLAARLQPLLPGPAREVVFVEDKTRYGLHLYLRAEIERVSFKPHPKAISDADFDKTLAQAFAEPPIGRVFILKAENADYFLAAAQAAGVHPLALGALPDERGDVRQDRVVYTLDGDFPAAR
jgi:4-amino-4-deoxy-L-arabinose transferase-like glycosyltransferase